MLENFSQPFGVGYPNGDLGIVNKAFEELTGYSREELKSMTWSKDLTPPEYRDMEQGKLKEIQRTGKPVKYEKEYIRKDGSRIPVELQVHIMRNDDGTPHLYYTLLTDITKRKRTEKELFLIAEFLRIVNESKDTENLIESTLNFFKQQSSCEAIGIRLHENDDYPYFESNGFPEEFILLENELCARDEDDKIIRDSNGNVLIECMCGNVICGRTDPSKPFFTFNGSFWTNSTTELLKSTTEEDRQARTRNRCNGEGYESVTLIPLFVGENRLGLIQLNDSRKGVFTQDKIDLWERLSNYLSIALAKFMAEDTLQESEEKYRELFNNANDMISLNLMEDDGLPGKFIDVNRVGVERLGYTHEEFMDMTPADIIVEDKQSLISANATIMSDNENLEFEIIHLAKNGRRIPVEVNNHLFDLRGKKVALAISRNITERKLAEEALLLSEEKYKSLFEEDPDYTILLGKDGVIRDANYATINLSGLSKEELIGKHFSELRMIIPEDLPLHLSKINRLLNGETIEPFESQFVDDNNTIHTVLVHLKTVFEKGNIDYILGIATDITALKLAEDELKTSLNDKNTLIQEIHHRVKNNMQIISSLLNLQKQYVDKEAVDVLQESQNRVKSMAMIHEKLYQSEDLIHINFEDYINSLVSNLFYSYNIEKGQIEPVLDIENVNLNMETAVPCGLIISELVSNSLKYAFPNDMKGKICVSLRSLSDRYELTISDNGVGLPKGFNFYNLESLGLLLVNNLTEQIDGEIAVNNSHGTEFKIIFKELEYRDRF